MKKNSSANGSGYKAVTLRKVKVTDAAALAEIYGFYVNNTAISFETEAPDRAEMERRIEQISSRYPFLVAVKDGDVVGYAYASALHNGRAAYYCSVEVSVYVKKGCQRQGIGRMLYEELEFLLKERAFVNAYACIAYPHEEDRFLDKGSSAFHKAMGYKVCGLFEDCAIKFDRWYSTVWMVKKL